MNKPTVSQRLAASGYLASALQLLAEADAQHPSGTEDADVSVRLASRAATALESAADHLRSIPALLGAPLAQPHYRPRCNAAALRTAIRVMAFGTANGIANYGEMIAGWVNGLQAEAAELRASFPCSAVTA